MNIKNIPVLPLRDIVVFPHMVAPLFVGRKLSVNALNIAMVNDKKIDVIKKVLMLDTKQEIQNDLDVVGNAISRELEQDDKDQVEFKKWKESKKKEDTDEIPF